MKIAVIGAGSWGTALAQLLAMNGNNVSLWARRSEVVKSVNSDHRNPDYLTDVELSKDIVASISHEDCCENAAAVVVVTPSKLLRGVARALCRAKVSADMPIIICSKGVESETGFLATEIFEQEMGNASRIAVLSGPNHAEEVVKGLPSGTVIASSSLETAAFFQRIFAFDAFRAYTSTDVKAVQICAASKNPIAIAVGISYGLGYGDNTASMLITRGLAEMSRLARAAGGEPITCLGLAGTGDMIATCMSQHSRNRRFGEWIAKGKTLDQFIEETHMVVEGAVACQTLMPLAKRLGVELPIVDAVRRIIWEKEDPRLIAAQLKERPLGVEFRGIE